MGALVLVVGLAGITACGGSDDPTGDDAATAATDAPGTSVTAVAQQEDRVPTSMAEWEALWEEQRAAVVARIKQNKWGKSADGRILNGPEGFSIDLSKCPAGWSDTEGIGDADIKIG
jgi:hypothetical protein